MVSVFSIFASLHMVEMKALGFGLAAAVLIDAVLVRAVVLPSLLVLLGRRRWAPPTSAGAAPVAPNWTEPAVAAAGRSGQLPAGAGAH